MLGYDGAAPRHTAVRAPVIGAREMDVADDGPNTGLLDSSQVYRINSTAHKINVAFEGARREARDEALWLSAVCRQLLDDNDRLRVENERLRRKLEGG